MSKTCFGILTPRIKRSWQAYANDRRGLAAVEFAMVAAPFFLLIFGLLEVCILFFISTIMEHAVSEASRQIRTGQAQTKGFNEQNFRAAVCDDFMGMLDCDARLHIDVKALSGFSAANIDMPIDENGKFDADGFTYNPGGPNDIVAVRVFYEWSLMTPFMTAPLANMADSKFLVQANAVFRNEPFGD
tara:strand:+ start:382 stop:942 length:561 start_codon:yes stop_codon:yes gene_type:complete